MFASLQRRLIYHPVTSSRMPVTSEQDLGNLFAETTDVRLCTADSIELGAWYLKSLPRAATDHGNRTLLIYFHGNAGNRQSRKPWYSMFHKLDSDVLAIDYRGYGDSEGTPDEIGLKQDAAAAWQYATGSLGYRPDQIHIVGTSLGGAIAVHLAAECCRRNHPPAGLIVIASFSSLTDVAGAHYPWLPVKLLLIDTFSSATDIGDVSCPILLFHGDQDEVVPLKFGLKLFEAAPYASTNGRSRQFARLAGIGHDNVLPDAAVIVLRDFGAFLQGTTPIPSVPGTGPPAAYFRN